jgi:hypothetical protein
MTPATKQALDDLRKAVEAATKYLYKIPGAHLDESVWTFEYDSVEYDMYYMDNSIIVTEGVNGTKLLDLPVCARIAAATEIPNLISLAKRNEHVIYKDIIDATSNILKSIE